MGEWGKKEKEEEKKPVDKKEMARDSYEKGRALLASGDRARAMRFLEHAVETDKDSWDARMALAKLLMSDTRTRKRAETHLLEAIRIPELAELLASEHGKVIADAKGDVQRGLEVIEFACGIPHALKGEYTIGAGPGIDVYSMRQPLGVCAGITPFNFPMAIPTWKIFPALLCGNAVVFKPSSDVPHTGHLLVEVLLEAGLPTAVVQLVHGGGGAVGNALVAHPRVPLVSFTGSTEIGARLGEVCGRMHKRLSLEMGGKNAIIVMDDADVDLAVEGAIWGAFGTSGQRCTASSRLIVHKKVYKQFVAKLVEHAKALRVGNGADDRGGAMALLAAIEMEELRRGR